MALRTSKSNIGNEEHKDLSFNMEIYYPYNHQQEDESSEEETKDEEKNTKVNQMMIPVCNF